MMSDLEVEVNGERMVLMPERALYWASRQTLCVADPHLGKPATVRGPALPLPGSATSNDLARLSRALERTRARRLMLLGDLLHPNTIRGTRTLHTIAMWRARHAHIEIILVRSDQTRGSEDPPPEWYITCIDEPFFEKPFVLRHTPGDSHEGYTLAGHIHPAVVLARSGRQRMRRACFVFGPRMGVLPAFGSLTGTATIRPEPGDRVYAIAEDEVVAVG